MNLRFLLLSFLLFTLLPEVSLSQLHWRVGGRVGLSVLTGGETANAGFQIGPTGEIGLRDNLMIGTDFTVNTQAGTPVLWMNYVRYYLNPSSSAVAPYLEGGILLDFSTGGPYFGIIGAGGAEFSLSDNISVPAEVVIGPLLTTPGILLLMFRTGINYAVP